MESVLLCNQTRNGNLYHVTVLLELHANTNQYQVLFWYSQVLRGWLFTIHLFIRLKSCSVCQVPLSHCAPWKVDCLTLQPIYHIKMEVSCSVPYPRTQHANLPAIFTLSFLCWATRKQLVNTVFKVFGVLTTELNPCLPTVKQTL